MIKRPLGLLLTGVFLMSIVPNAAMAVVGNGSMPHTGDDSDMWIWVALAAVGIIGFGTVLYLLLVPRKKGKYEREEKK